MPLERGYLVGCQAEGGKFLEGAFFGGGLRFSGGYFFGVIGDYQIDGVFCVGHFADGVAVLDIWFCHRNVLNCFGSRKHE